MREDPALQEHVKFFSREMRIRAYQQFLESYRSVQLKSMAHAFGVTAEYLDA
jgi:26S proteasome regulatory subunit N7